MNTKKFIAGILACCAVGGIIPSAVYNVPCAVVANAEDTEGTYELLTYKNYGDHIEITDCDETATEVEIPSEIDGLPVTSIYSYAFFCCYDLESVTIPDSVTSIDDFVFAACSNLKSITIPESVTHVGRASFSGTALLEEKRQENPLVIINNVLIDGTTCTGDVVIPDNVKVIGDYAFEGCSDLTSIVISDNVTSIGYYVFHKCENLTSVTIPYSVTSIEGSAFSGCSKLSSIEIPESLTEITGNPFSDTVWLEERRQENPLVAVNNILIDGKTCSGDVVVPENITEITYTAFSKCPDVKSVTILNPDCKFADRAMTISSSVHNNVTQIGNIFQSTMVYTFDGTIYGYENSTAQAYAEKYGYKFEVISDSPETPSEITGDANGDNTVDLADAVSIIQHIGNESKYALSEQGVINADCNGDGKVTGADALEIQKLEAGLIDKLPYA